jgi:hypothetical protein
MTKSGIKRVLFDVAKDGPKIAPKSVPPLEKQEPNESRRLWAALTEAIQQKDMERATIAKTAVEDAQRGRRRTMEERGEIHVPRFFEFNGDHWVPKITLPDDSVAATAAVNQWIFPEPSTDSSTNIPS